MLTSQYTKNIYLIALGAASILGFAPTHFYPATFFALAGLFYSISQTDTAKNAAWCGFWFGAGFFCAGTSWVYVSLHDFGGMPWWMAGPFTLAFCLFLALFHSLATYLAKRIGTIFISAPILWVVIEWLKSWIFTGFPWLNIGYSHIPLGPMAGFSPIVGIYGVSLICATMASLVAFWYAQRKKGINVTKRVFLMLASVWICGSLLKKIEWTGPIGLPFKAALVQGNIPQLHKWDTTYAKNILSKYTKLVENNDARLIILPESAMPTLMEDVPTKTLDSLKNHAVKNKGAVILGAVESDKNSYFNSVFSLSEAPQQRYRKSHLVPFGEFIPLKSLIGFIYRDWLNMPLSDFSRGSILQQPLEVFGTRIAVNICYEDAFGEEIIRQLPQAELLVNVSNMAWFGNSWAPDQHLQMSQARAIETGRMMLRSTNTGATAVIDVHGEIIATLPYFQTGVLVKEVQAYQGTTPYVRWGNWPFLIISFCLLAFVLRRKNK